VRVRVCVHVHVFSITGV